jgi:hypothetical protein
VTTFEHIFFVFLICLCAWTKPTGKNATIGDAVMWSVEWATVIVFAMMFTLRGWGDL